MFDVETAKIVVIVVALLTVPEALAFLLKVEAKGPFQTIWNLLKFLVKKATRKEDK